jgi:hypothetical protein
MNPREMIDRYTHEVARQLPAKSRDDIRQELDSLLTESAGTAGGESRAGAG